MQNNKSAIAAFEALPPQEKYVVDVLLNCAKGSTAGSNTKPAETTSSGAFKPCPAGQDGEPLVCPVLLSTIASISHIRVHMSKDLRPLAARETMWKVITEVKRRFPKGITLLDPMNNMNIKDVKFKELVEVSRSKHFLDFWFKWNLENCHAGETARSALITVRSSIAYTLRRVRTETRSHCSNSGPEEDSRGCSGRDANG
jgi:hypothetical protein